MSPVGQGSGKERIGGNRHFKTHADSVASNIKDSAGSGSSFLLSKSSDKAAQYGHIIAFFWFLSLEKGLELSA